MRKAVSLTVVLTFVAAFASAQMKSQVPKKPADGGTAAKGQKSPIIVTGANQADRNSFPRISAEDALKLYKENKAVFIDVRSSQSYSNQHIHGALNIPRSEIIRRYAEVPVLKTVITYCACGAEESSGAAAANLIAHGVKNVWALKGGIDGWKSAGGPVAAGPK
jgi:thiosulfate/3-mercaptopyruvate sulfurtransferase